jgi:hypothetical protein
MAVVGPKTHMAVLYGYVAPAMRRHWPGQSDEIVEPDLDLYWAKASTALTVFRLLHEVGHFRQFSEILTNT